MEGENVGGSIENGDSNGHVGSLRVRVTRCDQRVVSVGFVRVVCGRLVILHAIVDGCP